MQSPGLPGHALQRYVVCLTVPLLMCILDTFFFEDLLTYMRVQHIFLSVCGMVEFNFFTLFDPGIVSFFDGVY